MPVLTRRRTTRILIIAAALVPLLLAGGAALISVLIGQSCSGGTGISDSPSQVAVRDIPSSFLSIYETVGARYGIPWEVLAGIGEEECDHGRTPDPRWTGVHAGWLLSLEISESGVPTWSDTTEGNTAGGVFASRRWTPRGRRTQASVRSLHAENREVSRSPARADGGGAGRTGKAKAVIP